MKRFHVHVGVPDLAAGIRFYSGLFGAPPTVLKDDYAKWLVDDPRVNFAISQRGRLGINHLGVQAESADELADLRAQFEAADRSATVAEPGALCCYAKSDKHWVTDPQGIAWEAFHTLDAIPLFGSAGESGAQVAACCSQSAGSSTRATAGATSCCTPTVTNTAPERPEAACCNATGATTLQLRAKAVDA